MKKACFTLCWLLLHILFRIWPTIFYSGPLLAKDIIDVYGIEPHLAKRILAQHQHQIEMIETQISDWFLEKKQGSYQNNQIEQWYDRKQKLLEKIKKTHHFAFVDIQTVHYPNQKDIFSTLEIIQDQHSPRLRFVTQRSRLFHTNNRHDLIQTMIDYQNKAMRLFLEKKIDYTDQKCPVYHCIVPFNHPTLKPYLNIFNEGIKKDKKTVIDVLTKDKNPDRRAAAAFLIGHINNPNEIIDILSSHIDDPDQGVRNNVLRVIGETIWRAKIHHLNALPYLHLLDSPYVSDRNKALLILNTLADHRERIKQIASNNHGRLERLAALKQPNNHDIAVNILKKIRLYRISEKV